MCDALQLAFPRDNMPSPIMVSLLHPQKLNTCKIPTQLKLCHMLLMLVSDCGLNDCGREFTPFHLLPWKESGLAILSLSVSWPKHFSANLRTAQTPTPVTTPSWTPMPTSASTLNHSPALTSASTPIHHKLNLNFSPNPTSVSKSASVSAPTWTQIQRQH